MARARPTISNNKVATFQTSTENPIVVNTKDTTVPPAAAKRTEESTLALPRRFVWSDEDDTSDEDKKDGKPTPPVKTIKETAEDSTGNKRSADVRKAPPEAKHPEVLAAPPKTIEAILDIGITQKEHSNRENLQTRICKTV